MTAATLDGIRGQIPNFIRTRQAFRILTPAGSGCIGTVVSALHEQGFRFQVVLCHELTPAMVRAQIDDEEIFLMLYRYNKSERWRGREDELRARGRVIFMDVGPDKSFEVTSAE